MTENPIYEQTKSDGMSKPAQEAKSSINAVIEDLEKLVAVTQESVWGLNARLNSILPQSNEVAGPTPAHGGGVSDSDSTMYQRLVGLGYTLAATKSQIERITREVQL